MTPPTDFTQAYGRFLPSVRAKCRRLLGRTAAAEDVAQEAFIRLLQSGPRLDGTAETRTVMAWLYLTSTRLAIDLLRSQRFELADREVVEPTSCAAPPEAVIAARSAVIALAANVPSDEIEAALLARVDGLSQPEVASILGISERTVRRLLDRFDERTAGLKKELL